MKRTAASVLDAIDNALGSASSARHDAVMAEVPDLEPIPGPWVVETVIGETADYGPFTIDGIVYDGQCRMGVDEARPIFEVFDSGDSFCKMSRGGPDRSIPAGKWHLGSGWERPAFRYADERWVW